VFRQSDPRRAAVDAHRSLLALYEWSVGRLPLDRSGLSDRAPGGFAPPVPDLAGFTFAEVSVDNASAESVTRTLSQLGFVNSGRHRTKPVQLWSQGAARVLVNHNRSADPNGPGGAGVAAVGFEAADPASAAVRAQAMLAPLVPRDRGPAEADLSAVAAPDGTQVFFCRTGADDATSWIGDFADTGQAPVPGAGVTAIDHIELTQPFDRYEEATLFLRSVLGLEPEYDLEIAAPFGLVRIRSMANEAGSVRIGLSGSVLRRSGQWIPGVVEPQNVAFATSDIFAAARAAQAAGAPIVPIPANYYDDLDARLTIDPDRLTQMRRLNVLLDRTSDGDYWHFYTAVLGGRVFFEVLQRDGGYRGNGELDAPVRMSGHRRQRIDAQAPGPAVV